MLMRSLYLHTIALVTLNLIFSGLFAQDVELNEIDCSDLISFEEIKVLPPDVTCNCDYRLEYVFTANGNPLDFFTSNTVDIKFKINTNQSNFEFPDGSNEHIEYGIDLSDLENESVIIPVLEVSSVTIIHIPDDIELIGSIEFEDGENFCFREYSDEMVEITTTIIQIDEDGGPLGLENYGENFITYFDLIDWDEFDCDENDPNYLDCKSAFLQSHGILGEATQSTTVQNGNQPILVETEDDDDDDEDGSSNRETIINVDDIWGITKVYPNPNSHKKVNITISERNIETQVNSLIIFDSKMTMVKAMRLNYKENLVSIEDLSPGLYFLQLRKKGKYSKVTELLIY